MSESLEALQDRLEQQKAVSDFWQRTTLTLMAHLANVALVDGMKSGVSLTTLERYWGITNECLRMLVGDWNKRPVPGFQEQVEKDLRLAMLKLQSKLNSKPKK